MGGRDSIVEEAEAVLTRARGRLDFGHELVIAESETRRTLTRLADVGVVANPRLAEREVLADATLLLGRALRMRGEQDQAATWLDKALRLYMEAVRDQVWPRQFVKRRICETLNHSTLIELNRSPRRPRRLRVALDRQYELVTRDLDRDAWSEEHLDNTQRHAELLLLEGRDGVAEELLRQSQYLPWAQSRPDHSRALRLFFVVRASIAAGEPQRAADALSEAERLPVVTASGFVQIMYLEAVASYAGVVGEDERRAGAEAAARRLRIAELVDEERRLHRQVEDPG